MLPTNNLHQIIEYNSRILVLQVVKILQNLPNWDARLNYAVDHCNCTDDEKVSLKEMISTIKQYLSDIAEYKPTDELITAEISLIKPLGSNKHDNCGLPKVSANLHVLFNFNLIINARIFG